VISSTRIVRGEIDEHGNLTPEREGREAPAETDIETATTTAASNRPDAETDDA
jgi:pantetheine-phosphate adenylyltransferase